MTTKLSLINNALRLLKTRKLTESELVNNSREPARISNEAWDADFVRGCLERGNWRFAIRARQILADAGIDPQFDGSGFQYAFAKDEDWVRTVGVYSDPNMQTSYNDYNDESGYLFANVDTLYVRFVSDDSGYGGDLSKWPRSFQKFAEADLASLIAGPMTQSGAEMLDLSDRYLKDALSLDVFNEPSRRAPYSSWVSARMGGSVDRQRRQS
jgi:hypothetical protein